MMSEPNNPLPKHEGRELPAPLLEVKHDDLLLRYQQKALGEVSRAILIVVEKGRRIGLTWAIAADAVVMAAASARAGGANVFYVSYTVDITREFIDTCAMWARAFMNIDAQVGEFMFDDEDEAHPGETKHIKAFRIEFASGFAIKALSSRPRSIRGRQGLVIIDEAAFCDNLAELLKSAMALIIWGARIVVISTHDGTENPFNRLINDIKTGKQKGNHICITFDDAVADGLYERVRLCGKNNGMEKQEWIDSVYAFYADNADEELRCIPKAGSGVYIPRVVIEACQVKDLPVLRLQCPDGFTTKPQPYREKFVEDWLHEFVDPVLAKLDTSERHAYALDFARTGDLSIFVPLAIRRDLTRRAPFVVELKNVPYEQQKQFVLYVTERLPRRGAGKFDATGNGGYLAEVTMQAYGEAEVECVHLSQKWYLENAPKLKAAIEDRAFEFPADDYLTSDLAMIRLMAGVPMVPQGAHNDDRDGGERHGDFALAAMLAYAASLADYVTCRGFIAVPRSAGKFDMGGGERDDAMRMRADEQYGGSGRGSW
jgi:phage FluMu gp28-like protein